MFRDALSKAAQTVVITERQTEFDWVCNAKWWTSVTCSTGTQPHRAPVFKHLTLRMLRTTAQVPSMIHHTQEPLTL